MNGLFCENIPQNVLAALAVTGLTMAKAAAATGSKPLSESAKGPLGKIVNTTRVTNNTQSHAVAVAGVLLVPL